MKKTSICVGQVCPMCSVKILIPKREKFELKIRKNRATFTADLAWCPGCDDGFFTDPEQTAKMEETVMQLRQQEEAADFISSQIFEAPSPEEAPTQQQRDDLLKAIENDYGYPTPIFVYEKHWNALVEHEKERKASHAPPSSIRKVH